MSIQHSPTDSSDAGSERQNNFMALPRSASMGSRRGSASINRTLATPSSPSSHTRTLSSSVLSAAVVAASSHVASPPPDAEWDGEDAEQQVTNSRGSHESMHEREQRSDNPVVQARAASSSSPAPTSSPPPAGPATASASHVSSLSPASGSAPSPSPPSSSRASHHKSRRSFVSSFLMSGESNVSFHQKAPSILPAELLPVPVPVPSPSPSNQHRTMHGYMRARTPEPTAASDAGMVMPVPHSASIARARGNSAVAYVSSPLSGTSHMRRASSAKGLNELAASGRGGNSGSTTPRGNASTRRRSIFRFFSTGANDNHRNHSGSPSRHSSSGLRTPLLGAAAASNTPTMLSSTLPRSSSGPLSLLRGGGGGSGTGVSGHNGTFTSLPFSLFSLDDESHRRMLELEAKMSGAPPDEDVVLADEDFVTYDLARQQEFDQQRREIVNQRFQFWTKKASMESRRKRKEKDEEEDETKEEVALHGLHHRHAGTSSTSPLAKPPSSTPSPAVIDSSYYFELESMDESWVGRLRTFIYRHWITRTILKILVMGQGWILVGLIGALTGLIAALCELSIQWLTDLKSGYCTDHFWLSNSFCCVGSKHWNGGPAAQPLLIQCEEWYNWDRTPAGSPLANLVTPFFAGYAFYIMIGVVCSCMSAWLVVSLCPHASGSGIPEVKTILGGVVIKKYLGATTLLVKPIALILSVGGGLSIDKEGGFVHLACCIANVLCRYFPESKNNVYKKNDAISAAAAAGISVAFGAPIGGVLFSLEEVSSYFPHRTMFRAFFCALVASIVLQYIDPYQAGKVVLFQVSYNKPWVWFEMAPFIGLAIMGGLIGAAFIRLSTRLVVFRRDSMLRRHPIMEVLGVAFFTLLVRYLSAFMRGNNNSVLASLFGDCESSNMYDPLGLCDNDEWRQTCGSLALLLVCTFIFTTFSWALCVPGGIFIPALLMGATMGRIVGTLMLAWQRSSAAPGLFQSAPPFTPGIYALVGAAATLGGVTRLTVSLVVIVFEFSGGLLYLLPIMVGATVSKVVGDAFGGRSLFDSFLALNRYPFLNTHDRIPPQYKVADAMTRDVLALPVHGHTVESLESQLELLAELRITGFPIVTTLADPYIVGYINRSELRAALKRAKQIPGVAPSTRCYFEMISLRFPKHEPYVDLRPWLHPSPIQVVEHTPLYRIHELFKKMGLRYALVVRTGRLAGIVTKKDVLAAIERSKFEERQRRYGLIVDNWNASDGGGRPSHIGPNQPHAINMPSGSDAWSAPSRYNSGGSDGGVNDYYHLM